MDYMQIFLIIQLVSARLSRQKQKPVFKVLVII